MNLSINTISTILAVGAMVSTTSIARDMEHSRLRFEPEMSVVSRVSGVSSASDSSDMPQLNTMPAFSAHHRLIHIASQEELVSQRFQVSEYGLKVDQLSSDQGASVIFNSVEDKLWMIDHQRGIYHQVPLVVSTGSLPKRADGPYMTSANGTELPQLPDQRNTALEFAPALQFQPCQGMEGVYIDSQDAKMPGRQLWKCSYQDNLIETQWYDRRLGVVVYSESVDGFISELSHIKLQDFTPDHFQPNSRYRQVSVEELLQPNMRISRYKEFTNEN